MGSKVKNKLTPSCALPCLVCGVDSGPVLSFFFWMVGAGVLGSICFLVWAIQSGKFKNEDKLADTPLRVEDLKHE